MSAIDFGHGDSFARTPVSYARRRTPGVIYQAVMRTWTALVAVALALGSVRPGVAQAPAPNVVVITIDGLRWQEMFGGADLEYFKKDKDGKPVAVSKRFWRDTAQERRAAMMPFVWGTIATKGQI